MKRKIIISILITGLLLNTAFLSMGVEESRSLLRGNILYVGGSGPGNYSKIQDAIDSSSDGDTVFVYSGTYYENVVIGKSIELIGENKDTTIINGGVTGNVIKVLTSSVTIKKFTLEQSSYRGIYVEGNGAHISNIYISDCKIQHNIGGGIYFYNAFLSDISIINCFIWDNDQESIEIYSSSDACYSNNLLIKGCYIYNNGADNYDAPGGIRIWKFGGTHSSNIHITECTISTNYGSGVDLWFSDDVVIDYNSVYENFVSGVRMDGIGTLEIRDNYIHQNGYSGIDAYVYDNVEIYHNKIYDNRYGIHVSEIKNARIHDNDIYENYEMGMYANKIYDSNINIYENRISNNGDNTNEFSGGIILWSCSNNFFTVENNTISSNLYNGILLRWISGVTIINNTISSTDYYGVYLFDSSNNIIRNNTFSENAYGLCLDNSSNNAIFGNNITDNNLGIYISAMFESYDNKIYHNNFLRNGANANDWTVLNNQWDDGSQGNYWDDYSGKDLNRDGIGDTPYRIDPYPYSIKDRYPLMKPWPSKSSKDQSSNQNSQPVSKIINHLLSKAVIIHQMLTKLVSYFKLLKQQITN